MSSLSSPSIQALLRHHARPVCFALRHHAIDILTSGIRREGLDLVRHTDSHERVSGATSSRQVLQR